MLAPNFFVTTIAMTIKAATIKALTIKTATTTLAIKTATTKAQTIRYEANLELIATITPRATLWWTTMLIATIMRLAAGILQLLQRRRRLPLPPLP